MKNWDPNTDRKNVTVAADVKAGDVHVMGAMIGVHFGDVTAGQTGTVAIMGIARLDAASADAWNDGDQLYWDSGAGELTNVVASNTPAGKAHGAKSGGTVRSEVHLNL